MPKLTMFRRAPAWNSSQIDERCFIYCTQTSRGRARIESPHCRTICIRRVFGHEVSDGSYDSPDDPNLEFKPQNPIPLPPEGQHPEAVNSDGEVEINENTRYWKEGRYIWTLNGGRWITHEKVDTMVLPIAEHAKWVRQKESMLRVSKEVERTGSNEPIEAWRRQHEENPDDQVEWEQPAKIIPPLIALKDSFLGRFTPISTLIQETLHHRLTYILNPTANVLGVLRRSFAEGTQARFWKMTYEHATNGSALKLVQNAWGRRELVWKKLEDEDERKKKGGGGDVREV